MVMQQRDLEEGQREDEAETPVLEEDLVDYLPQEMRQNRLVNCENRSICKYRGVIDESLSVEPATRKLKHCTVRRAKAKATILRFFQQSLAS